MWTPSSDIAASAAAQIPANRCFGLICFSVGNQWWPVDLLMTNGLPTWTRIWPSPSISVAFSLPSSAVAGNSTRPQNTNPDSPIQMLWYVFIADLFT